MIKDIELKVSIIKSIKLTILTLIMWVISMSVINIVSNGYISKVGWITGWICAHIGELIIAKQVKIHK